MKNLKHLAANVVLLLYCVTASAQTFEVDGLSYTVTSTSDMTVSVKMGSVNLSGDLVIPSTVISDDKAYFVTSIEGQAFYDCRSLTSISIPEIITAVGKDAFDNTGWYANQPDGVLYIGDWLYGYKGEMPEDFELVVKDGTKGIVDYAFEDCSDLIRVTIPESTKNIGDAAFISSGLILVTMSEGVNRIGGGAFWGCRSLTDVAIPESVTEVGNEAFAETAWSSKQPCGVLYLSDWAVGLKNCGDCENCEHMNYDAVYVLDGTKGLAEGFTNWSSVVIPESVVYLDRAFAYMNGGGNIVCKSTVPPCNIDSKTFERVNNSSTLYVPANSVAAYSAHEYWGEFANIKAIDFPIWSLTAEGELIIDGMGPMENYECEYTPWYIYHSSIKSVTIKEGITSVGDNAFAYCEELASVSLPNSLISIGEGAFAECDKLKSVVIPKNVTTIGSGAFVSAGLSSITCDAATPPVIADWATFHSVGKSIPVYVPLNSVEDYKNADYWNEFTNIKSVVVESGTCGANLTWTFCETGELIIEGIGEMLDYTSSTIPWKMYLDEIIKVVIKDGVTSIGKCAFYNCGSLISIIIPKGVNSIGDYAFYNCSNLASVIIPEGVTSIGYCACSGCKSLVSISIPASTISIGNNAFGRCAGLENLIFEDGTVPLSIGCSIYNEKNKPLFQESPLKNLYLGRNLKYNNISGTYSIYYSPFANNQTLKSVIIGEGVTSLGQYAFYGCKELFSISIPSKVASIGNNAFGDINEVVFKSTIPPSLESSEMIFNGGVLIVPAGAYADYCTSTYWSELISNITIDDVDARVKILSLVAANEQSSLHAAIGDNNLKFVTNLVVSGTINSYDFMVLRTKMPLLRILDLSNTKIVYNEYEHFPGFHSKDNVIPEYAFYQCKLLEIKLPKSAIRIGGHALAYNTCLYKVMLPEELIEIGDYAFERNLKLEDVDFPATLEIIGVGSFGSSASNVYTPIKSLDFSHTNLKAIGSHAFKYCRNLCEVKFPVSTLQSIGGDAFGYCSSLCEIHIPSSVRTIGNYAFSESGLENIYVYTVEPINISQNTFNTNGSNFVGNLHAPKVSYYTYWYTTPWNQFMIIEEFDEPYDNFYLQGDKILNGETGDIRGEEGDAPDAEMGSNSGIIVEDDVTQDLGNVDIEHNGSDGGSIIVGGEGCVNADKLHFHINVQGGRWYFFCFPFDVRSEDIKMEGGAEWVFRYYDGAERAKNGKGGWKNVTSDGDGNHLKAATGYIFQCSKDDVLILTAKNQKIKHEKKYNELVEHITGNAHDASWNFVGNPYLSYYEVSSEDYSAPLTVWDGSKYIAIRPGDDDYQLAPFEAFFVQKPEGVAEVDYTPERQHTYHGSKKAAEQARARRRAMPINPDRQLVNITLSDGTATDQTRVVFNDKVSMEYEMACDAAKFSTADVPQLYTMDSRAVKYAINERPVAEGIVTLGYTAPAEGIYTLAAPRMDTPIYIKDNFTGTIHDFSEGSYEFASEAGTFDDRFTIIMKAGETGIDNAEIGNQKSEIYNVKGQRVNEATEQGVYIKENRKVVIK